MVGGAGGSAIAPSAAAVSGPLRELAVYESIIQRARKEIRDPRVTSLLMHRRKELERSMRGVDPDALQELEESRAKGLEEMQGERDKLKAKELEKQKEKNEAKAMFSSGTQW